MLFPYLNGEDLNSRPDQSPSRWVINFHDWPLEKAETYPDCMKIVREKVKPERDKNTFSKNAKEKWWQYERGRPELYSTIADMKRVLVCSEVTKHLSFCFVPNTSIYSANLDVFASEFESLFAMLQSTIHEAWARMYSSQLETRLKYSPGNAFENFPKPQDTSELEHIGAEYHMHRRSIMLTRYEGLTQIYNRFHNPQEKATDVVKLRELHKEMDEAVARDYGWDDLKLEHGFHETKQGLRCTISEAARREVLDRLLLLNHQRHEEEVQAGLFGQKGGKGRNNNGKKQIREREGTYDLQNVLFSE